MTLCARAVPWPTPAPAGVLEEGPHRPFARPLRRAACGRCGLTGIQVLQVNVGKLCNQTCRHCHVDAGPERREVMTPGDDELCLDVLARATFRLWTSRAAHRR